MGKEFSGFSKDGTACPTLADLKAFLRQHRNCAGLAIANNGVDFRPLPDEVAGLLYSAQEAGVSNPDASTTLDMVIDGHRNAVIGAFAGCWRSGYAHCMAVPFGRKEPQALTFWDLRAELEVFLVVLVPDLVVDEHDTEKAPLRPRLLLHTVSEGGLTLTCGTSTELLLGWTADDLVGRARLDFVHPEDHEDAIVNWVEMLAKPGNSSRTRLRYRHKVQDRWLWFEITQTNLLDTHGHVSCEMLDITDEQAALDALQERERLLARLTEALPTGVLHVGSNLQVLFANERFGEITGLEPKESRQYLGLLSVADRELVMQAFQRAGDKQDSDLDMTFLRPDGQPRRCRVQIRTLGDAHSGVLLCVDDITESSKLQEQLEYQATTDALTGVANRLAVLEALASAQTHARATGQTNAVVFLDLDGFKQVNDQYGHAVGDQLLIATAQALVDGVRPTDVVGRLGGDEFLVVCPNVDNLEAAEEVSARLQDVTRRTLNVAGNFVESHASCGLAVDTGGTHQAEELVAQADAAMYDQKNIRTQIKTLWGHLGLQSQVVSE